MSRISFLALVLLFTVFLYAETPAEQFKAAYTQWTAHRPDGMTWDDDSTVAVQALNTMWSAAAQVAADFLSDHPAASAKELSRKLVSILPETDPRFGPPLSVNSLEIKPGLFLVAFNSYPAGTAFAITRGSRGAVVRWSLSQKQVQKNDSKNLLSSWYPDRSGNACVIRETYALGVCGPMSSVSVGSLPETGSGQPRFFILADYSKDMGATFDEQVSIWTFANDGPKLDWIHLYAEGGERETVPNGIEYKDGLLRIAEKHEFKTFTSCGSCSGRQMIRRVRVTPNGVHEDGLVSVDPALDIIDDLFQAVADKKPTTTLASPQVVEFLRPYLLAAGKTSRQIDPKWFSVGMLDGYQLSASDKRNVLCFQSDEIGSLDFTLERTAAGYFVSQASKRPNSKHCGGVP